MAISNIIDEIRLLFIAEKKPYLQLKEILGFYPRNISYYKEALIHKSVAYYERERLKGKEKKAKNETKDADEGEKNCGQSNKKHGIIHASISKPLNNNDFTRALKRNNERLEFLGDAILGAIVADILYKHYAGKQEGFLTALRSKIVCRKSLGKLAVDIGLDRLVIHAGAVTTGHNSYMHGNAFEAFFGAIYLDRGYKYCYRFLEDRVFKHHINIEKMMSTEVNYKSAMLEWCQRHKFQFCFTQDSWRVQTEHYTPKFRSTAWIEGIECGVDEGYSKKEADQKAAKNALAKVKKDKAMLERIRQAQKQRLENAEHSDKDADEPVEEE